MIFFRSVPVSDAWVSFRTATLSVRQDFLPLSHVVQRKDFLPLGLVVR